MWGLIGVLFLVLMGMNIIFWGICVGFFLGLVGGIIFFFVSGWNLCVSRGGFLLLGFIFCMVWGLIVVLFLVLMGMNIILWGFILSDFFFWILVFFIFFWIGWIFFDFFSGFLFLWFIDNGFFVFEGFLRNSGGVIFFVMFLLMC